MKLLTFSQSDWIEELDVDACFANFAVIGKSDFGDDLKLQVSLQIIKRAYPS